jgi:hypothetical protein
MYSTNSKQEIEKLCRDFESEEQHRQLVKPVAPAQHKVARARWADLNDD